MWPLAFWPSCPLPVHSAFHSGTRTQAPCTMAVIIRQDILENQEFKCKYEMHRQPSTETAINVRNELTGKTRECGWWVARFACIYFLGKKKDHYSGEIEISMGDIYHLNIIVFSGPLRISYILRSYGICKSNRLLLSARRCPALCSADTVVLRVSSHRSNAEVKAFSTPDLGWLSALYFTPIFSGSYSILTSSSSSEYSLTIVFVLFWVLVLVLGLFGFFFLLFYSYTSPNDLF